MKPFVKFFKLFLPFLFLFVPCLVLAWPTTNAWIPIYKGGDLLQDPLKDAQGPRNIVSDATHDAAYMFNDGQYIYFRLRLDQDPTGTGGQGFLKSFGWGVEIDSNLFAGDYEWLMMVDGISQTEVITLQQNSVQATLGDPGDKTESICASITVGGNHLISPADTAFNGDQDYFLDWRFPYDTFKQCTGLDDYSPLRLFFGSSSSTNNLTEKGADLVGGSDLYTGFSDYVTPFGTRPATGVVRFVEDLVGNTDVTVITAGDAIFIRVDEGDQNYNPTTLQTVTVTLTTPAGESETLILTETGVDTGVFSGSIPSVYAAPVAGDGVIGVTTPDQIVTVTYIDRIDANLNRDQVRTDTLTVLLPPVITASKTVNPSSTAAGGTVSYTIVIANSGEGEGFLNQIKDVLPTGFSYVADSTSGLTADNPTINGQILTWNGTWTVPRQTGGVNGSVTISFQANAGNTMGTFYNNVTVSGSNFDLLSTGDTAPVTITAPLMKLTKSSDKANGKPGDEIIYTVYYQNLGDGPAHTSIFFDTIPPNTTYVSGSLRLGNAGSSYATASPLTDTAGDDAGEISGNNVVFRISVVLPDDGVSGSGTDEGKVFFKVTIN
ncbi:hypothetical protein ACFL9U_13435 [Thermodesulfobacteriota bacterium]